MAKFLLAAYVALFVFALFAVVDGVRGAGAARARKWWPLLALLLLCNPLVVARSLALVAHARVLAFMLVIGLACAWAVGRIRRARPKRREPPP